jgi:hypothetical protein
MIRLDDYRCGPNGENPPVLNTTLTVAFYTLLLVVLEMIGRLILIYLQSWVHPILSMAINQQILARHVFVDTVSCIIVSILGWQSRTHIQPIMSVIFQSMKFISSLNNSSANNTTSSTTTTSASSYSIKQQYETRFYQYIPAAFRISTFFIAYQLKNLYDTIVWGDGPEYVFHHIFALFTALGAIYPGNGHMYTIFFFGLSEVSTAVLCLLANFDDHQGIHGLGDVYPMIKIILGALFVSLFILCRVLLWPVFSYYFVTDCAMLLQQRHVDDKAMARTWWLRFFLVSNTALSILQIGFLSQIFIIGHTELSKMGYI